MDVVVRAVNQRFVDEVVFPVLEQGVTDAVAALEQLQGVIVDSELQLRIEGILERNPVGGWSEVDADRWQDVVYGLLFSGWRRTPEGWVVSEQLDAYAAPLNQALHIALMITDPFYPYWDSEASARLQEGILAPPFLERGLPGFLSGLWDPLPPFVPGELLTTRGTNLYRPAESVAIADWSHRSREIVSAWSTELPRSLQHLLEREIERLRPIEVPEANELLDHWLGLKSEPPPLNIAFSGLGPGAVHWVREVAAMALQIRRAASREQGLTAIVTGGHRSWF